ncbi:MAG: hypothetical protein BWY76_03151 [bacterium ADurb.Bin429]|nr:MAG: hypothetical protein BWY76_03151 [bacterium ADurb.Bin429]
MRALTGRPAGEIKPGGIESAGAGDGGWVALQPGMQGTTEVHAKASLEGIIGDGEGFVGTLAQAVGGDGKARARAPTTVGGEGHLQHTLLTSFQRQRRGRKNHLHVGQVAHQFAPHLAGDLLALIAHGHAQHPFLARRVAHLIRRHAGDGDGAEALDIGDSHGKQRLPGRLSEDINTAHSISGIIAELRGVEGVGIGVSGPGETHQRQVRRAQGILGEVNGEVGTHAAPLFRGIDDAYGVIHPGQHTQVGHITRHAKVDVQTIAARQQRAFAQPVAQHAMRRVSNIHALHNGWRHALANGVGIIRRHRDRHR